MAVIARGNSPHPLNAWSGAADCRPLPFIGANRLSLGKVAGEKGDPMKTQPLNMICKRLRKRLTLLSSVLVLSNIYLVNPAMAQPRGYSDWHMGRWMMGEWGVGWFGMTLTIFFWVIIIVGLVLLIKWLIQTTSSKAPGVREGSKAMDILKERYARGEINRDEFESMKKDILQ